MDIGNNHSSLPSPGRPGVCRYEVFLSFRGGDVRRSFIQFLYESLTASGIYAFIDHDGIEIGEEIMSKILQLIRHTEICIPVFSKDFASSKSCLKEVAEMVACDRKIMPIFYDVSPSVVRKQEESYQKSFCTHAALGVVSATIDNWKKALQIVSKKLGWELQKFNYGEQELIKEVVSAVRWQLKKDDLDVQKDLVGMGHHVQEMMNKLDVRYENGKVVERQMLTGKRVVEIWGLPGIGKSTLAIIVRSKIHHLFDECSFLEAKGRALLSLQEDLICDIQRNRHTPISLARGAEFIRNKFKDQRVLIVLDDVSDFKQILSLGIYLSEFGPGSRIIMISMRSNLVDDYIMKLETSQSIVDGHDEILVKKYELEQMNDNHAFQLFCKCALRGRPLQKEFYSLAWDISSAAEGLPLLIDAVGSSLFGKSIDLWEDALNILGEKPFAKNIKKILKTRYKALEEDAKKIFLDIACFLMKEDKTIPPYMWEACKYNPRTHIPQILNTSLVKSTENNKFWMHNQVKFLGMNIVEKENPRKPYKRTRLWNQEDIERAMNEDKVATVEALSATFDSLNSFDELRFFRNFPNLRYLRISHAIIDGNEQLAENSREDLFLPRLKWLEWRWCQNISSLLALDLSDLVVLDLSRCTSTTWKRWKKIMEKAKNLKVLILKDCYFLAASPVSHAPANLERLNLEHCFTLAGVGRSISKLRNLVSLNIKFCSFVQELPEDIGSLEALKELYIDGTSIKAIDIPDGSYGKLKILSACNCKFLSLPNSIGNLKSLSYLGLDETELRELPCSIGLLESLQTLSLRNCRSLWKLPDSIGDLKKLQVMDLSSTIVDEIPSSVKDLQNLKELKMAGTHIREFPGGIKNLESLEEIDFSGCRNLRGECNITGLSSLRVLLLEYTDISRLIVTDRQSYNPQNLKLDGDVPISIIGTIQGYGIGSTDVRLDHRSRLTDIISACDDESETVAMWRSDRSKEVIGG
ncbi:disease resistance protein RPV1 [Eucalyptus grandis]|uniref:disease resistance protein RPV1 n=1 Tax=Eucalyptus grandis TaxID=71139 RepID=UPI00192F0162|nr:disease resistance protein RPV1 [Eucalyptus grandis]